MLTGMPGKQVAAAAIFLITLGVARADTPSRPLIPAESSPRQGGQPASLSSARIVADHNPVPEKGTIASVQSTSVAPP